MAPATTYITYVASNPMLCIQERLGTCTNPICYGMLVITCSKIILVVGVINMLLLQATIYSSASLTRNPALETNLRQRYLGKPLEMIWINT